MSTYCKLVGGLKMAKGKYITINEALDDDDWAFSLNEEDKVRSKQKLE